MVSVGTEITHPLIRRGLFLLRKNKKLFYTNKILKTETENALKFSHKCYLTKLSPWSDS
jgi:hypothetical protein